MLEQLKIENFRCFKSFELNQLGRVNLLVGENNCGKTSILEALKIFYSGSIINELKNIIDYRSEYLLEDKEYDLTHLFYQHEITLNKHILLLGYSNNEKYQIDLSIIQLDNIESTNDFLKMIRHESDVDTLKKIQEIILNHYTEQGIKSEDNSIYLDISSKGKLLDYIDFLENKALKLKIEISNKVLKTQFITPFSFTPQKSLEIFNQVVLTPEEDLVYQALQIIEPNIERIAPIGYEIKNIHSRGGFFVRLKDTQKRIPIGSMGDGIWRMLGLSLALVSAKDGVLLVDEIDTGLHYTALEDMWKLIWETSKKLNVQVFATTHNSDCWKALEALTSREDVGEEDISIQRIEKDAPRSVAYNKEEIATAVDRETEVR